MSQETGERSDDDTSPSLRYPVNLVRLDEALSHLTEEEHRCNEEEVHVRNNLRLVAVGVIMGLEGLTAGDVVVGDEVVVVVIVPGFFVGVRGAVR
mmetsp:Transcript_17447/g.26073  ORF Transcript_17447/g.26073 Transcript_17447/m.26073 type:complete len:95 (-) Transcript_17447:218-502(-)